eukprot:scaffold131341_cov31-Tisochrysis_lutea.AAC.2
MQKPVLCGMAQCGTRFSDPSGQVRARACEWRACCSVLECAAVHEHVHVREGERGREKEREGGREK